MIHVALLLAQTHAVARFSAPSPSPTSDPLLAPAWASARASWASACAAAAAVVAAAVAAIFSYFTVREMRRQNAITDAPVLFVTLRMLPEHEYINEIVRMVPDGKGDFRTARFSREASDSSPPRRTIYLEVQNLGRAPALHVELTLTLTTPVSGEPKSQDATFYLLSIAPGDSTWVELQTMMEGSIEYVARRRATALAYRELEERRIAIAANGNGLISGITKRYSDRSSGRVPRDHG